MGISDYDKSSRLMSVIERQLESSSDPDQYLIDICHVLINQQHQSLTNIATYLLQQLGEYINYIQLSVDYVYVNIHQLGQSIPDKVALVSISTVPSQTTTERTHTSNNRISGMLRRVTSAVFSRRQQQTRCSESMAILD